MKILMVYCNTPQDNKLPMGIAQLISCLIRAGHDVKLFHTTFHRHNVKSSAELRIEALQFQPCKITYESSDMYEDLRTAILNFRPEIIGFSVVEPTFRLFEKLVNSGRSRIDGNDIRIKFNNSGEIIELDRMLDPGSSWNSNSTKIWFQTQSAISSSSSNYDYFLFYGNKFTQLPASNSSNVFFFYDGFERF